MATRTERVVLELDDQFTSGMARAAASAALLRRELDGINGSLGGNSSAFGNFNRSASTATASVNNFGRGLDSQGATIDRFSGRLGLIVDGLLALGPGLVPIGAVGAVAIGGLTAAATAAAVAGGSAIVAFQGLGEAVKAIDAYQLDPTIANLDKAREALEQMSPAAQQFVMEFQKFSPVLDQIKDQAEAGWFPGLTESLDDFARLGPSIERIFFKAGEAGGFLVDSAAESLASDRWAPFLAFLEDEVPTAMGSLTRTMGSLAHGAAEMFMAFDPGNDSFLQWIEDVADGFDSWAQSAEGQESIEGFLEYARENGPAVAELFSSLVGALSAIVKAAAPLGGPVLAGLTAVANMIEVIAESDIATPILAGVAALRIYNRVAALAAASSARFAAATTTASTAATAGMTGAAARASRPAGVAAPTAFSRAAPVLASAAGIAVLVAAAAATAKAASANNDLVASLVDVQNAIDALDFGQMKSTLATAGEELEAFRAKTDIDTWELPSLSDGLADIKNDIEGIFGDSDLEEGTKEFARLQAEVETAESAVAKLGRAMGMSIGPTDGSARSVAELEKALALAKPAMDALGVSQEDLTGAKRQQELIKSGDSWANLGVSITGTATPFADLTAEIKAQAEFMDSAQGKAENYKAVLRSLSTEEGTAADRANALNEALSAMIDPANDLEAAISGYREALKSVRDLNADAGFSQATEESRKNLEITRAYSDAVKTRLTAMVNAGKGERDLAREVRDSRREFIQSGVAAGFSAGEMRKRANAIGLTPKLVSTTFRALGINKLEQDTMSLRSAYNQLPKDVRTRIRNEGIPQSIGEARRLADELDLTAKERRALMRLVTEGQENMAAAKNLMNSFNDKTVTMRINTIRTESLNRVGQFGGRADGGSIPKDGGDYRDKYLYMLAPGEEVISNRYGQADQFRADRAAGRIPGYATGGTVGFQATSPNVATSAFGPVNLEGPATAAGSLAAAMLRLSRLTVKELNTRERFLNQEIRRQERQIRMDEREVARDQRALEREKRESAVLRERVDLLTQERDAIRDTISARLKSQLFSGEGPSYFDPNAFSIGGRPEGFDEMTDEQRQAAVDRERRLFDQMQASLAEANDPLRILQNDVDRAAEMFRLSNILGSRGLNGDALTELLSTASIEQIREFANGDQSRLDQYESLFNLRASTANNAGLAGARAEGVAGELQAARVVYEAQLVVQRAFAADLKESNVELREHTKELREINRRQDRIERALDIKETQRERAADRRAEKQSKDTGDRVAQAVNGAAVAGQSGRTAR